MEASRNHIFNPDIVFYRMLKSLEQGPEKNGQRFFYDIEKSWGYADVMVLRSAGWNRRAYCISDTNSIMLVEDRAMMLRVNILDATPFAQSRMAKMSSDPGTIDLTVNLHHDYDGDGLDTQEEMDHLTADFMADTDQDFLGDLIDAHGTNIAIAIAGRPVTNVCTLGTDPNNPDSDSDGVLDGEEVCGLTRQNG